MKILFDQGTPAPLRGYLADHSISTAYEMGWDSFSNGVLLDAAEKQFDLLITTDKNIKHQQNLSGRKLAILVLPTTNWPQIERHAGLVRDAVDTISPDEFKELTFPANP